MLFRSPGPAASAFVLQGADGTVLDARGDAIGIQTNNVAEYRAAMIEPPAAIPHMLGDFLLGGVSKDVPADYFVKVARTMRRDQHTQVAGNDAVDAAVTGALRAGAWARKWGRQLLRRG